MTVRTISAGVSSAINDVITTPIYLLSIGFAIPLNATSGPDITENAISYTRQGLSVTKIGDNTLNFSLLDDDNAVKALIDAEGIDDITLDLVVRYGAGNIETIFTGFLDGVKYKNHYANFQAVRVNGGSATFPDTFFTRGQFPYLPVDGKVVKWDGLEITLRSK